MADISAMQPVHAVDAIKRITMKRIVCIGECSLNVILASDGTPKASVPGGRILNAAAILARKGFKVIMASEVSADPVGDIVASYLSDASVDLSSLDRFTEGHTPLNIFTTPDGEMTPSQVTRYEDYPDNCFDIVWPRLDEGDVVIFGGYYALDARMRERLVPFLNNAVERKAVLIYLPGFLPQQEPRITRVMPAVLENLEMASVVVARTHDLKIIFGVEEPEACYHSHIDFYCRSLISIDEKCGRISYYAGREHTAVEIHESAVQTMMWNAGATAGIAAAVAEHSLLPADLDTPTEQLRSDILTAAVLTANQEKEVII